MEQINQNAIKFFSYIKVIPKEKEKSRFKGSTEHIPTVDLSDKVVDFPIISKELNLDDSIAKIYKTISDIRYGFEDKIYPHFLKFSSDISKLPCFTLQASENFIIEESFNWIINSYVNKKIEFEYLTYLQKRIDEDTEFRTYHFPVLNLHIQESFKIGEVKFQFFTKEYFDAYWNPGKNKKDTKEDFDNIFSKYYGKVFLTCSAKAETKKAEELAFAKASLAMDIFRLFTPAVIVPTKIFKVDLEKRININYSSDFLVETNQEEKSIIFNMCANNDPFYFDKRIEESVFSNGLSLFSQFISKQQNTELYKLIIHSISFYSLALSFSDFHLRISHIIMIIEGLLLEEGWIRSMQKKTTNRICKLLFINDNEGSLMLISVMNAMYEVRNEITHKGNKLPIDLYKFRDLQVAVVELLKKIISLNSRFNNKNDLIVYIENLK